MRITPMHHDGHNHRTVKNASKSDVPVESRGVTTRTFGQDEAQCAPAHLMILKKFDKVGGN